MGYHAKPRSYSKRHAFVMARDRAKESGKPCFVIYDEVDCSYFAVNEIVDELREVFIAKVDPPKTKNRKKVNFYS